MKTLLAAINIHFYITAMQKAVNKVTLLYYITSYKQQKKMQQYMNMFAGTFL